MEMDEGAVGVSHGVGATARLDHWAWRRDHKRYGAARQRKAAPSFNLNRSTA
jgi:hypothetical protein